MTRLRKSLIATTLGLAALDGTGSAPTDPETSGIDPTIHEAVLDDWTDHDPLRHLLGNGDTAADGNSDDA